MLKQRSEQINLFARTLDFLICVAAFFAAGVVQKLLKPSWAVGGTLDNMSWMLAASAVLHLFLYSALDFYKSLRLKSVFHIIVMVLKAFMLEIVIMGSLVFFLQFKETSRYFFLLFLTLNYAGVMAGKLGARITLSVLRKRGYNFRQVIVAGTGSNAARVIQTLNRNRHWGYVVVGALRLENEHEPAKELGTQVIGELKDLESIAQSRPVDEVYFAPDEIRVAELSPQLERCEQMGITAHFSLSLFELPLAKIHVGTLEHLPMLTFYTTMFTPAQAILKRVMDVVIAALGLVVTGLLFPWISWKIKRESPGPVIFKQIRVGENGRKFKCYKFRTMSLDAETRKAELEAANKMQGPIFKIDHDPRIFAFGQFLRKTSLDELPQFLNILRGDMSVVGTRPPTPDEVARYELGDRRRLSIRPGLTGLWQVSGRNEIQKFEDIVALDLKYIDEWSLWLDIQIIFRTLLVVFVRKGAV